MDISAVTGLATQMAQQRTSTSAQMLVLKKALTVQADAAMTLIDAASPLTSSPSHLGQNVNVVA